MNELPERALVRAIYKMLRPMVRLLMRHGVSYRLFADIARHAYVDVARADFTLPGRKQTNARLAVLTGINRKDIAKLAERPHPLSGSPRETPTPASRVITGWLNDPRFKNSSGQLKVLAIEASDEVSFTTLVNDYSHDVPVRALLDELLRIGAVDRNGSEVRLLVKGYVPQHDMAENMRIFGTAAADLIRTMDHNIADQHPGPFIQRTVSYDHIPLAMLPTIRRRATAEANTFLLQINDWLANYEQDPVHEPESSAPGIRAGIGIYYFEDAGAELPSIDDSENPPADLQGPNP